MKRDWIRGGLALACAGALCALPAIVHARSSCVPHKPPVDGLWKDDVNGQQVEIAVHPYVEGDRTLGKIVATYTKAGKVCKNPDRNGKPVPFQVDFDGTYDGAMETSSGLNVSGLLYYCAHHKPGTGSSGDPKFNTPYTIAVWSAGLSLTESGDGMKLAGTLRGLNGNERITFSRLAPAANRCEPSADDVEQAFGRAFRRRGITPPPQYMRVHGGNGLVKFDMGVGRENDLVASADWIEGEIKAGRVKPPLHNPPVRVLLGSIQALCGEPLRVNLRLDDLETNVILQTAKGTSSKDVCSGGLEAAFDEALGSLKATIGSYKGTS